MTDKRVKVIYDQSIIDPMEMIQSELIDGIIIDPNFELDMARRIRATGKLVYINVPHEYGRKENTLRRWIKGKNADGVFSFGPRISEDDRMGFDTWSDFAEYCKSIYVYRNKMCGKVRTMDDSIFAAENILPQHLRWPPRWGYELHVSMSYVVWRGNHVNYLAEKDIQVANRKRAHLLEDYEHDDVLLKMLVEKADSHKAGYLVCM